MSMTWILPPSYNKGDFKIGIGGWGWGVVWGFHIFQNKGVIFIMGDYGIHKNYSNGDWIENGIQCSNTSNIFCNKVPRESYKNLKRDTLSNLIALALMRPVFEALSNKGMIGT